jgi:hypothetical protein
VSRFPRIRNPISAEFLEIDEPAFVPYLFIESDPNFPSSIAMAGATGNSMKYVNLLGATAEKLSDVQIIAREAFAKNNGAVALYGPITGFVFVYSETEAIRLDAKGNEISRLTGKFWPKTISIQNQV